MRLRVTEPPEPEGRPDSWSGEKAKKSDRYVPVPLPRWELLFAYAVWVFHSGFAFVISYRYSIHPHAATVAHGIPYSGGRSRACYGPVLRWIQHHFHESRHALPYPARTHLSQTDLEKNYENLQLLLWLDVRPRRLRVGPVPLHALAAGRRPRRALRRLPVSH